MICQNSIDRADTIMNPGCFKEEAKYEVVIHYNKLNDTDSLLLCENCMKLIVGDAKKHGYRIDVKLIK